MTGGAAEMGSHPETSPRHLRTAQLLFLAASIVFAATTVVLLRRPLPWLIGVVADDGFYYFKIALNLVHTGRSTFDGVNPTNGYQPLWMLVATAGAALVQDKVLLLRVVLGAGFFLHGVATLLLTRTLAKLTSPSAAWIAGAVWLLNPFAQVLLLQGVEAPVFLLSLVVVLHVYGSCIEPCLRSGPAPEVPARNAALFGAALGLAFLARSEVIISGAAWIALIALALWRHEHGGRAALRFGLIAGAVWVLVATPWLAFSWVTVGSLAQDSGTMKLLWGPEQFAAEGTAFRVWYAIYIVLRVWLEMPLALSALVAPSGVCAALVLPPLALAILLLRRSPGAEGLYRLTIGLLVGTLLTGAFYAAMLGDLQVWHLVQPALALFLLCSGWFYRWVRTRAALGTSARLRLAGYLVLAGAAVLHLRATFEMEGRYPWQRDAFASQGTFEALVPEVEPIGAFNAGIPGYFSERKIVNLDGLANHAAVAYWRRRDFAGYLKDNRIRYILDEKKSLDRALVFSRGAFAVRSLHQTRLTGWRGDWRMLWRVETP